MKSAADLFKELSYWNHIGTGDDIVLCSGQREEYQHLVLHFKSLAVHADEIPKAVERALSWEMTQPLIFQKTFWHLLKIKLKTWVFWK